MLVLDLNMPGGSSLEAIPRLRDQTAVVVLTMQDDPPSPARRCRRARSASCSRRPPTRSCWRRSGSPPPATPTSTRGWARARRRPAAAGPPDDLTQREVEVLRLIALGHTNVEIGEQLFLSTRTVETHRAHIQQKLNRTTRAELVRYALEHRLVDL